MSCPVDTSTPSRLNRLYSLLCASQHARSAALQLCALAQKHTDNSDFIIALLKRTLEILLSKESLWETRTAINLFLTQFFPITVEEWECQVTDKQIKEWLGKDPLLASSGEESSTLNECNGVDDSKLSARERFAMKRKGRTNGVSTKQSRLSLEIDASDIVGSLQRILTRHLLDATNWKIRHGACLGVKCFPLTDNTVQTLLELLCRERFTDYQGDQAIAPVRETVAQVLSKFIDPNILLRIASLADDWQPKHAALLTLKYACALGRKIDLKIEEMRSFLDHFDEDIRLQVLESMNYSQTDLYPLKEQLLSFLEEDEHGPAVTVALEVLSRYSLGDELLQKTLPLLRSSSHRLRKASLDCVLSCKADGDLATLKDRCLFQFVLLEEDQKLVARVLEAERSVEFDWKEVLMTPLDKPFDASRFVFPKFQNEKLLLTNTPPSHELGFQKADMLSLSEEHRLRARINGAKFIRHASLALNTDSAVHRMIAAYLGNAMEPTGDWTECEVIRKQARTEDGSLERQRLLWNRRVCCALASVSPLENEESLVSCLLDSCEYSFLKEDAGTFLSQLYKSGKGVLFDRVCCDLVLLRHLCAISEKPLLEQFADRFSISSHDSITLSHLVISLTQLKAPFAEKVTVQNLGMRLLSVLKVCELAPQAYAKLLAWSQDDSLFLPFIQEHASERDEAVMSCIKCILETSIGVRYASVLLPFILRRLSDQDERIRTLASHNLASALRLMSLSDKSEYKEELMPFVEHSKEFLRNLGSPSSIPDYHVPLKPGVELRHYQQAGLNWLRFLHESGLNGALCDDMGLGKTLQTLAMLIGSHQSQSAGISLIVCPSSLLGHWEHEIKTYTDLNCHLYAGPGRMLQTGKTLIVTTYEVVRSDIEILRTFFYNYIILDEGHLIKNNTTKLFQAIKQLQSHHRLVLSGTPIQNNVLELWSLFDFLMPGYLGSDREFNEKFAKPILQAQLDTSIVLNMHLTSTNNATLESAEAKLDALHKQVLPLILRRMKEDVLQELPAKIIQTHWCELGETRRRLYDTVSQLKGTDSLKRMTLLRRICTHPIGELLREFDLKGAEEASPKLALLEDLLVQCGVGGEDVLERRILIFAQQRASLDLVQQMLKSSLPQATFLRLDGSTPAEERFRLVQTFNQDPSIDCLLLTTHVGGLGLNLTSASIVIFLEHDWNPMADLQAMDRAHRIGQRQQVLVYRLACKNTIDELILGRQRFKTKVASTVVSTQNSLMQDLGEDEMLELLDRSAEEEKPANEESLDMEEVFDIKSFLQK